jgi:tripartite-type tricarboxylate transporter receptor subunit TctC
MPRRRALLASATLLAMPATIARAQSWPTRPIALVVPFTAGGSTDIAARILAERVAPRLGQGARIVVENRAGAGGSLGAEWARRQAPDGYTLLLGTASSHATNPAALPATTPYDPVDDFTAVTVVGGGPMVVVVPSSSPHRSFQSLVQSIRERPGAASWATSGAGGIGHLSGEYMKFAAGGLRAEHIPYRGGAQVMEALAKGEVDYSMEVLASAAPHLRDGISRGLAVTSLRRHALFPEIPTLDELGLKGFDVTTWNVLLAPKGLPPELTARLNGAANAVLRDDQVRERLAAAGVDAAGDTSPEQARAFLASELAKFRDIVTRAGIRLGGG